MYRTFACFLYLLSFCKKGASKQLSQYRSKTVSGALTVSQNAKNCQSEGLKLPVRTPLTENERLTQERKPCKSF